MELYVWADGNWVSMTGASGLPGNAVITTDRIDATLADRFWGEINDDGEGTLDGMIYSTDVIPAAGVAPMTDADGAGWHESGIWRSVLLAG